MNVEQILLGQMIMSKHAYFASNMTDEHFTPGLHQNAFRAIRDRYEAGSDVDIVLLAGDLKGVHPGADVAQLTDGVASASNWKHYAEAVSKRYQARKMRQLAAEIAEGADDPAIIERVYERLGEMQDPSHAEVYRAPQAVMEFVNELEERYNRKGALPGIGTGYEALDNLLLGLQKRRLIYVGARPSDGKTALLLNLAAGVCRQGKAVGFLSLESSRHELMSRLFSIVSGIDNRAMQAGYMQDSEFSGVNTAATLIHDWNLSIFDFENMPLAVLRSKAREMVKAHGAEVLFVDYIQLVRQTNDKPFRLHMNEVSMALKAIARELEVPVVVAAQLGRDSEGRRPFLSDFKETGQIEQDADVALLLWHEAEGTDDERSWILVSKNRDGAKGDVPIIFARNKMQFKPFGTAA